MEALDNCHKNDGAITEYSDEGTNQDQQSEILDDDQFENYLFRDEEMEEM